MKKIVSLWCILFAFLFSGFLTPDSEMESLFKTYVKAMNQEDFGAAMTCFHGENPGYPMIAQANQQLFANFDLAHKLISFRFIGMEGDYALTSVVTESRKVQGGMFPDNRAKNIYVFKKEKSKWKIWSFMVLESNPL